MCFVYYAHPQQWLISNKTFCLSCVRLSCFFTLYFWIKLSTLFFLLVVGRVLLYCLVLYDTLLHTAVECNFNG